MDEAFVDFAAKISPVHYRTSFQTSDQTMDYQIYLYHPPKSDLQI